MTALSNNNTTVRTFIEYQHGLRVQPLESEVVLGSRDEVCRGQVNRMQPAEVDVGSVEDIDRPVFDAQRVQNFHIVHFAGSDDDHAGDAAAQVEKRVQFQGGFGLSELRSGKERKAQIDGGGVQRVEAVIELDTEEVADIDLSGLGYQYLRKVGVDTPVSYPIGIGQRSAG